MEAFSSRQQKSTDARKVVFFSYTGKGWESTQGILLCQFLVKAIHEVSYKQIEVP